MITLLHGDDIAASRGELTRRLEEAENKGADIRRYDGKTLDVLTLTQAVESSSLFGGTVLVVIERFLSKDTKLADILTRSAGSTDIIIWEDKEIGKTLISLLGANASVKLFKTPAVIWELLDGIKPGNASRLLALFSQVLIYDAAERIFYHIVNRLRSLIMIKDGETPERIHGWQATRLTSQAKSFTMDKLLVMHARLLNIDIAIKTGTSPFPLTQQLELFVIDI